MTKQQAIDHMKDGYKMAHEFFQEHEYITSDMRGRVITTEDNASISANQFWLDRNHVEYDEGWFVWRSEELDDSLLKNHDDE